MDVVIAGGHGKIGMRLGRLLVAGGDRVRGLIRDSAQAADLRAIGVEPVPCDLESDDDDVSAAIAGADAVVFAAGAGPGSGAARKLTMDRDGAVKLIAAAQAAGTRRYVMVSAHGIRHGGEGDFGVYLRAKGEADDALRASGLDHTIVRPGGLTDDPGTGRVSIAETLDRGEISRDDVAAVLHAVLHAPNTIGLTFELVAGDTPIAEALATL